ncbi:uncharacterized protein Z520_07743 [Fonsecaea multimorphosa CBS 102226]|uniref:Uncharacterized protein n=1 Tax=Fonsecaea multimorphosa CBS 102226 TaxID=1442371 RepID=A0A0D2JSM7_9EURO|nr:uncharacterized protein Z520_07743 [Fonsecaea multimorphosa CBS 102226]KIX96477.1 hypothetical protein Z520_07743 [Fonsecaea multimorphosa CBS 102226]OAL28322.1 hypothetical protein AYO22_03028 [Fonsecaea multimorphosa]
MTGQTTATIAEQPTGTAQHIEYADENDSPFHVTLAQQQETDSDRQGYVGPWPLRRRSISSWYVLSDRSDATRSSIPEYTGNSAVLNSATKPIFCRLQFERSFQ